MPNLLEVYDNMLKEAEAQELVNERVEFLAKYAEAAEGQLQEHYPNNYTKSDVIELADRMIDHDMQIADMQEKTAEWDNQGREMAHDYVSTLIEEIEKDAAKGKAVADLASGMSTKQKLMLALGAAGLVGAGAVGTSIAKSNKEKED